MSDKIQLMCRVELPKIVDLKEAQYRLHQTRFFRANGMLKENPAPHKVASLFGNASKRRALNEATRPRNTKLTRNPEPDPAA